MPPEVLQIMTIPQIENFHTDNRPWEIESSPIPTTQAVTRGINQTTVPIVACSTLLDQITVQHRSAPLCNVQYSFTVYDRTAPLCKVQYSCTVYDRTAPICTVQYSCTVLHSTSFVLYHSNNISPSNML